MSSRRRDPSDAAAMLGWAAWWDQLTAPERAVVEPSVITLAVLADHYGLDMFTVARRVLPDGRRLAVEMMNASTIMEAVLDGDETLFPLRGPARLSLAGKLSPLTEWDEHWYYASAADALRWLADWDGQGEPDGWHRHVPSHRRRPDGDPHQEYIRP